jgi:stage V sporulation protein D (sporulation-specific penicillin-binding protein)
MSFRKKTETSEKNRRANTMIRKRVLFLMALFGMVTFLVLFCKLWNIQIIKHDFYAEKAIENQTRDISVSANRGKIIDRKGNILAISASVHNVIISPKDIIENELDKNLIADGLSKILDVDRELVLKRMEKTKSQYQIIATKIEDDLAQELRAFIVENKLSRGIYLKADTKRYYPYSSLAAQVVGFVNSENSGSYGLESIYEDALSGQKGRIVTMRGANGIEMLSGYEAYVDAENGNNLQLTIDSTIQYYAQRTIEMGIEKFEVLEGGFCIVMNPKTGEIYAMVSVPDYDLNEPSAIKDQTKAAELAAMKENPEVTEEEYLKALGNAQLAQWRSKAINDTYEPGSTFKPIVMAMALEEGKVTEDSHFFCAGQITVPGWPKPIKCHKHSGHGDQTLRQALMNSCNPAMIQIGQKIGSPTFYRYIEDFGLLSTTGVDMQGEGKGNFWEQDSFESNVVSLATASFGQRFQVTPIELITALSAVINGGHLMQPYVVQSVKDSGGNVVMYREAQEVRQVISQQTSDLVRSMMESVVGDGGTGKNAYVEGYRIGGKTGTSQTNQEGHLIVSFVGFAPADDPEIIVLLAYDHPKPASTGSTVTSAGHYISGGNMAAPMAGQLIADILDYMGIQKQGSEETRDVTVPNLGNKTFQEAQSALGSAGLTWKVVGSGGTVTDQTPRSGVAVPSGSAVVLYMGEEKPGTKVTVPDLLGRTYNSAKSQLEDHGLYMKASLQGNTSKMVVFSQSIEAGTEVEPGTVVEVRFMDKTVQDYAN